MLFIPALLVAMASFAGATEFLNHGQLLNGLENPQWFEKNIPLLDVPDKYIKEVYYYRWQTYKEHLVYTGAQYGYMSSEFLRPVGYGAPYGGIVATAGHHIAEGRWLRDTRYGQDVANYWLSGPGQFPKPMNDGVNKDTSDWAHEYSFWATNALWKQYLVSGDRDFIVGQLDNLVNQYRGWDSHYNDALGLYWQVPVWDATEYTAASYESSDPYHGGAGFRPTINSYQYGDALAISRIAALQGNSKLEDEYRNRAESLRTATQKHLWDNNSKFYNVAVKQMTCNPNSCNADPNCPIRGRNVFVHSNTVWHSSTTTRSNLSCPCILFTNDRNPFVTADSGVTNTNDAPRYTPRLFHTYPSIPNFRHRSSMSFSNATNGVTTIVMPSGVQNAGNINVKLLPPPVGVICTIGPSPRTTVRITAPVTPGTRLPHPSSASTALACLPYAIARTFAFVYLLAPCQTPSALASIPSHHCALRGLRPRIRKTYAI